MRWLVSVLFLFAPTALIADSLFSEGKPAQGAAATPAGFSELVKSIGSAVVNISVDGEVGGEDDQQLPLPFRKDLGPLRSVGSGFVIHEDGYIVTNSHVIDKAKKIVVRFGDDRREFEASTIGNDPKTDIALVKITPNEKLKTVTLGDSDALEVGDWVIAIGNQFQLGKTVTAGIVSAKSRRISSASGASLYENFIQTDASINPGSSGGPLFNRLGEVVGINSAIYSPARGQFGGTGFNVGIGFSIPINFAKSILQQLREKGKVTRGGLGVLIQPVTPEISEVFGLALPEGALVADVVDGSPAKIAGFLRGDIITSYGGTAVKDNSDLPLLVSATELGREVEIGLIRNNKKMTLTVKIQQLQERPAEPIEVLDKPNEIGLVMQDITEDIAKSLGLTDIVGVVVSAVQTGSPAFVAGFTRGDVILELNRAPVRETDNLAKMITALPSGKSALFLVRKKDGTRYLTVKIK